MQIHRIVRDLVTTKRNFWLDPIGAKPGDFVVTVGVSAARIAADHRRDH
jgi:microcompartment protein CcmK/EutM